MRERWLFIAWAFGRETILRDVASILVTETRTHGNGKCAALDSGRGSVPPGLAGEYMDSLPTFDISASELG